MLGHLIDTFKKNRKMQALLLLLVALAVADAGFFLLRVNPARARLSGLQDRLASLERDVAARQAEYDRYAAYNKSLADVERFKAVLPRRSEYTGVIEQVYRLAKNDGMASESFGTTKKDVKEEGDLSQLTFSMPIRGRYSDVRKFIHDVETSDLFLAIDSLGLSKVEEPDQISLTIGLSTFVRS